MLAVATPGWAEPVGRQPEEPSTAEAEQADARATSERPTPLEVDYVQYGIAFVADASVESGPICPAAATTPCILGSGGGPVLRGGYRPAGAWYIGGAYRFAKLDSNNQFRLGIFQELRVEARYFLDFGSRTAPYVMWGVSGVIYGNEWSADTGGAGAHFGAGLEFELTREALAGLNLSYAPVLLAGYRDTTGQARNTGIAHFIQAQFVVELRSELQRE